jgi:hypothetical protein
MRNTGDEKGVQVIKTEVGEHMSERAEEPNTISAV